MEISQAVGQGIAGNLEDWDALLGQAIARAQENLLRLQNPAGFWCGELMVDSTLCSDYVLFMHWERRVDSVLQDKCVAHIRRRQLPDGGWNIYEGGPSEINASVKAYFALKLAGHAASSPWMREARATILRLGGIPRMNTYAKLYLALLGQYRWRDLPSIPVELILLPLWLPFNIYEMSSWSRAMLIPLAIINHLKPTRPVPEERHLHELYPAGLEGTDLSPSAMAGPSPSWRRFFLWADRAVKTGERLGFLPLREAALHRAKGWMLRRMGEGSDGLAAVFPAMLNSIIALKALGYSDNEPSLVKARADLAGLLVDDPEDFRIQPCLSPVWDTAINAIALIESGGAAGSEPVRRAARWLASKEVRRRGDWTFKNQHREGSGWAFEFNNEFYPDTDDTMMVLIALRLIEPEDPAEHRRLCDRALRWLLSFQCRGGGWAAFDRDVTRPFLEHVPFADHNAILDPECSDLTGRMLELMGYIGYSRQSRAASRAMAYLKRTQEADGSWYGRWGVNYLYGTWQVLRGLRAIGMEMNEPWVVRARQWIESCQNEDGGWGESCASYEELGAKGCGPSTPSQTAWALMGLCAAGSWESERVRRGVGFLLERQLADGSWAESETTGTGFPRVFYLKYDMYRNNFPLLALATYTNYRKGIYHAKSFYHAETVV